jgi:hypothetical protein
MSTKPDQVQMDCDSETAGAVAAKRWKDSLDDGSHKFK